MTNDDRNTPHDDSLGTGLTDQQAADLQARPGRGDRVEPGAGDDVPEDATPLEPNATEESLRDENEQADGL